jgi:RNA polymerase sigma-70 factor (ECF subfamily)
VVDEAELLAKFHSEDPRAALATLFETYADPIYRLALSILADPDMAEDIVQETFLAALTHRQQFEGRSKISTWLYRIAYNASHDRLRKKVEEPLPEEEPDPDDNISIPLPKALVEWRWLPEEILANHEARHELEKAVSALPESLRVVFLLRDIEALSTEETAEATGISDGAVKVRLHRARMELRERLSGYFAEWAAEKREV